GVRVHTKMGVMTVYGRPDRLVEPGLVNFLRPFAQGRLVLVCSELRQRLTIERQLLFLRDVTPPEAPLEVAFRLGNGDEFLKLLGREGIVRHCAPREPL